MTGTMSHSKTSDRAEQSLQMDLWMIVCLAAAFSALEQFARLL